MDYLFDKERKEVTNYLFWILFKNYFEENLLFNLGGVKVVGIHIV